MHQQRWSNKMKLIQLPQKKKNENWVGKTLDKRKRFPIIVTSIIVITIVSFLGFEGFLRYQGIENKKTSIEDKIEQIKQQIAKIEKVKIAQQQQIDILDGLTLDATQPLKIYDQVCNFMKNREVIGGFYIKKTQNKQYANVLNLEIQVSYGDRDLLFVIMQIVSNAFFYTKDIQRTKLGVIIELYKPKE